MFEGCGNGFVSKTTDTLTYNPEITHLVFIYGYYDILEGEMMMMMMMMLMLMLMTMTMTMTMTMMMMMMMMMFFLFCDKR